MKAPRWYQVAAALILVGVGVGAGWVLTHRPAERSAVIAEPWAEMDRMPWLKANLVDAKMVIPDRPHSRDEAEAHRNGTASIGRVRRFLVSTNADHLRMGPLPAKTPGRLRIAAVGDSVTFGWGLPPEEAWVTLLQGELKSRGHDVEVLNAGTPGASVASLGAWCRSQVKKLGVDRVIWTRRLPPPEMGGAEGYAQGVRDCEAATGAPVVVFLPPISRFDLHGLRDGPAERGQILARLGPTANVTELTDGFRAAQGQRGETLQVDAKGLSVVDLETGKVWLSLPARSGDELPPAIGKLFEREPTVAEALIYDGGHPDAEGSKGMAKLIADVVEPTL